MFARATSGDKPNNNKFSACSKASMATVMEAKARHTSGCFIGNTHLFTALSIDKPLEGPCKFTKYLIMQSFDVRPFLQKYLHMYVLPSIVVSFFDIIYSWLLGNFAYFIKKKTMMLSI